MTNAQTSSISLSALVILFSGGCRMPAVVERAEADEPAKPSASQPEAGEPARPPPAAYSSEA
jgi:hypothetical protein